MNLGSAFGLKMLSNHRWSTPARQQEERMNPLGLIRQALPPRRLDFADQLGRFTAAHLSLDRRNSRLPKRRVPFTEV